MKKSILSFIIMGTILIGVVACGTNTDKQDNKRDLTSSTTSTTTTELVTTSTTTTTTKQTESTKSTTTKPKKTNSTTKPTKKKGNNSGTTKKANNSNNTAENSNTGTTTTTTTTKITKALSEKEVYDAMMAVKKQYPTGTPWDNNDFYPWKGGLGYAGGRGCAGFAFLLSDAAFGDRPARKVASLSDLKVGDIIRYRNEGHSIMVIGISGDTLTLAEGNMVINGGPGVIYWGRQLTKTEIMNDGFNYVITRW